MRIIRVFNVNEKQLRSINIADHSCKA